ncbi:hypothetical protein [Congregibacter sp.]|uniref:hypothetical protein n=1 Tax=Congregibacter sp. TaxID=2744308 RepID=UPI00385E6BF9
MAFLGKTLICAAMGLLFAAYANFAPTALQSPLIADYIKNHFVREIVFGLALAAWTISSTLSANSQRDVLAIVIAGSIVVVPFWVATTLGWTTGGLADVWGDSIDDKDAYALHTSQVVLFALGLVLLTKGIDKQNSPSST